MKVPVSTHGNSYVAPPSSITNAQSAWSYALSKAPKPDPVASREAAKDAGSAIWSDFVGVKSVVSTTVAGAYAAAAAVKQQTPVTRAVLVGSGVFTVSNILGTAALATTTYSDSYRSRAGDPPAIDANFGWLRK